MATALEKMPPKMREVCEILIRDSKAAAARELEMSQGALDEMLGRILSRFESANLRDYLA